MPPGSVDREIHSLRQRLALEARAYAREWSAERNARRLAGFYETVLAQHAARSEAGEPETA